MEFYEYLKMKAVPLIALFIVGVVAIVGVAVARGGSQHRASADLLVRPSIADSPTYSSDPDRYVNTQLSVLKNTPSILTRPAQQVGISRSRLQDALSASHGSETDIATLSVTLPSSAQAVQAVDAVSKSFISYLRNSSSSTQASLQKQITSVAQELGDVTRQVRRATRTESGVETPDPYAVAPEAAARQSVLTERLSQLSQQQAELTGEGGNPSRILRAASASSLPLQSGYVTLLAAAVGWALLVLLLAAVLMTLSSRVLGRARWDRATEATTLSRAMSLPGGRRQSRRRQRAVAQVAAVVNAAGDRLQEVVVTCLPEETSRIRSRTVDLGKALETGESRRCSFVPDSNDVFASIHGGSHAADGSVVVLLVDVTRTELNDLDIFNRLPDGAIAKIVPVLV